MSPNAVLEKLSAWWDRIVEKTPTWLLFLIFNVIPFALVAWWCIYYWYVAPSEPTGLYNEDQCVWNDCR